MLTQWPLKINGFKILMAKSWREDRAVIENVYETEAGTEQISVTRYDKMTVTASYRCRNGWMAKFVSWSKEDSLAVEMYDAVQQGYQARTMRMRNFCCELVANSERLDGTDGVWDVSFRLEEF